MVSGALPLKLAATLPAAGPYFVVALEAEEASAAKSSGSAGGPNGPFRGHFLVTVRSGAGRARGESLRLGPLSQTEP